MTLQTKLKLIKNSKYFHFNVLLVAIIFSFCQHFHIIQKDIQGKHSWRQSQTMWNIRNFTRHDGNILNPRVNHFNTNHDNLFRYEFPIMQWSMSLCQKVFGEDIQVIRILTFIIGIFSIFGMYFLVFLIFKNKNTALISAILFQYSPVFYFYTVNPIPDNLSLCTVIWYIYFILLFYENKQTKHLLLASFFLLLATLSKLPFLLFSIISIYYFFRDIIQKKTISRENIFNSFTQLIFIFPALLWYAWVIPGWQGNPILTGIFKTGLFNYENLMILKFHFLKMFPLLLLSPPIWILFVLGLISLKSAAVQSYFWLVLLILMTFLFLILEFSAINIVHDYYMFPFLPWLYIVIPFGIEYLKRMTKNYYIIISIICLVSAIYTPLYISRNWKIEETYLNRDIFKYQSELKNAIPQDAKCIILNDISNYVFSYLIDKRGYVFSNDRIEDGWVYDLIKNHGIKYMYSDSEKINSNPEIQKYFHKTILTAGSVKVFELVEIK